MLSGVPCQALTFLKKMGALANSLPETGTQSTSAWVRPSPSRVAVSMKITSLPWSSVRTSQEQRIWFRVCTHTGCGTLPPHHGRRSCTV